nr:PREDICTED: uncharacterized protein LOC109033539 [Bemisia tabaci]
MTNTLIFIAIPCLCVVITSVSAQDAQAVSQKGDAKREDHCNKTVDIYEDVSSPPLTPENMGKPMTCSYKFRSFRGTPKDWILRIRFKKFKVGTLLNASHCHGGYMQIIDGNARTDLSNRKEPGLFCGEIEHPQTFISETSFVKVVFHAENFTDQTYFSFDSRAEQQFEVYLRYGQHPELYPNRRGQVVAGSYCNRVYTDCRLQTCYVQSPAYPGIYPRHLQCTYRLNTRLPFIKLYIENEEFNIDGQRCENIMVCPMRPISSGSDHCPYDYIRIYDGKDATSPVIGTFCGMGKFPYSIIGTTEDIFVEFVSSPAGPLLSTGFHFNVGNWPGHIETAGTKNGTCNWILSNEDLLKSGDSEGIFLSIAHWYPPHTTCTYLLKGRPEQIVRIYFPSFRINTIESPIVPFDGDCGESLTLYDASWADDARIIKTFCDTFSKPMEKHDFVSTGPAIFVRFESKTGSYSGSSLYYWAHYDFFNNTRFGVPTGSSVCDEEFVSWKTSKGSLRSPLNTLVYKQAPDATVAEAIKCRYKFLTDRRLYARILLTVNSIGFKEHPFNNAPCMSCWEDKLDKLVIWEPASMRNSSATPRTGLGDGKCICRTPNTIRLKTGPGHPPSRPIMTLISTTEQLYLEMAVEASHAASSYFKYDAPLFEASYEFVHGPLCGPTLLPMAEAGEINYPNFEALGYTRLPRAVHCIWELRVTPGRDVWLHAEKISFITKDCRDGHLAVYLPSNPDRPFISVCGHNVSALQEMPAFGEAHLTPSAEATVGHIPPQTVQIQFVGPTTPAHTAIKIYWTESFRLPRNPDGSVMTSRLIDDSPAAEGTVEGCAFECPYTSYFCIPKRLVCDGAVNCPPAPPGSGTNATWSADEDPQLCATKTSTQLDYYKLGVRAGSGLLLTLALLCVIQRYFCCCCSCCCCSKRRRKELAY